MQSEGGLCLTWISDGGVGLPHPDRLMQRPTTKVLQRFQNLEGVQNLEKGPKLDRNSKIWAGFQNGIILTDVCRNSSSLVSFQNLAPSVKQFFVVLLGLEGRAHLVH